MEYKLENYLNPTKNDINIMSSLIWSWVHELRSTDTEIGFSDIMAISYSILVNKQGKEDSDELFSEIKLNYGYLARKEGKKFIGSYLDKCDEDILKSIIINYKIIRDMNYLHNSHDITPDSIVSLAIRLLDIKKDDSALDLCSGFGSFLNEANALEASASYEGVDINSETILTAKIISAVTNNGINYRVNSVFNVADEDKKYNKVFSNYPLGMGMMQFSEKNEYFKKIEEQIPAISKASSSDWLFNSLVIDCLENGGRAVCLMTNGSVANPSDSLVRKYFIDKGYVKAVITLPKKMFEYTTMNITMVLFEKNENKTIKFVDASDICQKGRRSNYFSEEDIDKIIECLSKETDFSGEASIEQVAKQDYILTPLRYIASYLKMTQVQNGVEFGSVISSIRRGASIKADQLDSMAVNEETDFQFLKLSDIKDGVIQKDLPFLSSIEPNLEKYCVQEGDLIMSKNGYPYKVAVMGKTDKKVLANGNLFIIRLDPEKATPYYIKALFESEKGIALLNGISAGAFIPNFGVKQLKSLLIPLPSLDTQKEVAEEFERVDDEIEILKARIQKILNRKNDLFEKLSEGE